MHDVSQHNPTGRFTGLADLYARHRPTYPAAASDLILSRSALKLGAIVIDVGCGTGISSRLFAERGLQIIGIEPNDEMRAKAEAEPPPAGGPTPRYQSGRAEATGLPAECADLVLCAQAFHWFEPPAALAEFHRILRPGGWVALMWNERDESDPATAAYGKVVRSGPNAAAVEGPRSRAGEPLLHSTLFSDAEHVQLTHDQEVDEKGLLGRALSASYAPREPEAVKTFAEALRTVFAAYQRKGKFLIRYVTGVYLGRRSRPPSGGG
jgi:SAM-dependent methyltransferase